MASHTFPADHPDDGLLGGLLGLVRDARALAPSPNPGALASDLLAELHRRIPSHPDDAATMGWHRRENARAVLARMCISAGFDAADLVPVLRTADPLLCAVAEAAVEARESEGDVKDDALKALGEACDALAKDARL